MQVGIVLSLEGGGADASFFFVFFCYLFEKSVRLIQYKDMKVINLCFLVVVSSKNTSEFGHLCVNENEGIQLVNGL